MKSRSRRALMATVVAILVTTGGGPRAWGSGTDQDAPKTDAKPKKTDKRTWSAAERQDALRRAHVWMEPAVPIERAALDQTIDGFPEELSCKFIVTSLDGTTPKFECTRDTGEEIKVKYGKSAELHGEVAATRLTAALGFGADRVSFVKRVACYGCPRYPFVTMKAVQAVQADDLLERALNYDDHVDFKWVAVERRFDGEPIVVGGQRGWALFELEQLDGRTPGAPRAHVDALRLLAVFLAHWDNKAENQRLVCRDSESAAGACAKSFALLQDLGATFGPYKVDVDGWKNAPIWKDRASCTVTMETLPYNGATFRPVKVSEAGRQFLGTRLARLSDAQIESLFRGARFHEHRGLLSAPAPLETWMRIFKHRVRQIADGPACPQ